MNYQDNISVTSSLSFQPSPRAGSPVSLTTPNTERSFGLEQSPVQSKRSSESIEPTGDFTYSPLLELIGTHEVSNRHLRNLRDTACKLYGGTFPEVKKHNYLAYLAGGSEGIPEFDISVMRCFYMSFFKWDASLLRSLRLLCNKLYFKGESQHIDKIIDAFAVSWFDTFGGNSVNFGSSSGVYLVAYSLILLNTDLHNSDLNKRERITKTRFVENTLEALKQNSVALSSAARVESELKSFYDGLSVEELRLTTANSKTEKITKVEKTASKRTSISSFNSFMPPAMNYASSISSERSYGHSSQTHHSVGFANALMADKTIRRMSSHDSDINAVGVMSMPRSTSVGTLATVLQRIDSNDSVSSLPGDTFIIEEEGDLELELEGPPWVKEGLVYFARTKEIQQQDSRGSSFSGWFGKSKPLSLKKTWSNVFAVVSKGELKLFSFEVNQGALKGKKSVSDIRRSNNMFQETAVGDGNWQSSANCIGSYNLCSCLARVIDEHTQTAKVLRSEYTQNVPNRRFGDSQFWSVQLPLQNEQSMSEQETLFFVAGTYEVATEFVDSCNFWAARSSAVPPDDAISSIDYGLSPKMNKMDKRALIKYMSSASISKWTPFVYGLVPSVYPMLEQLSKLREHHASLVRKVQEHKDWVIAITKTERATQDIVSSTSSNSGFLRRSRKPSDTSATAAKNMKTIKLNYQNKLTYLENEATRFKAYIKILQLSLEIRQRKLQEQQDEDVSYETSEYTAV